MTGGGAIFACASQRELEGGKELVPSPTQEP
jgi:hypothetical protein